MRGATALFLLAALLSVAAGFAMADCSAAESGTCGDDLTWDLDDGRLVIDGTGAMADFEMNPPWDAESVTNVTIGGSVTSIGDCAFYNCSSLSSLDIPGSVTSIGDYAFHGCSSLSSLDVPGSVTSIGYSAFAGSGLETLRLADGVASIGRAAFTNCSALGSVVIPSSVVSIGDQAFTGCPRLSIAVDEGSEHFVTDGMGALYDLGMTRLLWFPQSGTSTIDSKYVIPATVTKIAAGAFLGCRGVVYMALPGTVETIGDMAFFNSGLVTLKLADGVKSIGKNAFAGCPLSYLVMADTVETFQFGAFHGCNFKDAAGKEFSDPDYDAIKGRKYVADTDGTLVEYMPKVGGTFVVDGVKYKINGDLTVGVRSYAGSAEEVRLDTVRYLGHDYSVTAVYKSAFEGSDIKELTLGDSVSSVSSRAFYGCKGLVSADLGPVESLGAKAFAHCTSLTSVNVSKVVTVGAYAFYGCSALASADLSSAETIGDYAFSACYGMKEIVFSENLKDLGAKPFCWLSFYENGKKMPRTVKNLTGCTFAGEGDRTLSLVRDA